MKIAAVVSAFNEETMIGKLVEETKAVVSIVIVVNDCSSDRTSEIAKQKGADIVIDQEVNLGQGASIQEGIRKALEIRDVDIIVTLDGDYQHDPNEIAKVIAPIVKNEADVVIGSRLLSEDRNNIPKLRLLFNQFLSFLTKLLFSIELLDSQSGFRGFSRKAASKIDLKIERYSWTFEMADQFVKQGLRCKEVPITPRYFQKENAANAMDGLKMIWQMFLFKYFSRY